MAEDFPPPNFDGLIATLLEGAYDPTKLKRLEKVMGNAIAFGQTTANGAQVKAAPGLLKQATDAWDETKQLVLNATAFVLAHLVAEIIGVEVPTSALSAPKTDPDSSPIGNAIGAVALNALRGPEGELEPGDEGAKRFIGTIAHIIVHGWAAGIIAEKTEKFFSISAPIEEISKLGEELVNGLGLSRLARIVLRPLAVTALATPLEWQTNKRYHPNLLGAATVARQVARGRWTRDQANEELERQGYSVARIDALLSEQLKFLTADDLAFMVWQEIISLDEAVQTLGEQGYDAQTASKHLNVQALKREDTIDREIASAASTAFADGRISDSDFTNLLDATIPSSRERDLLVGAGRAKRALRQVHLSPAEARACVLAHVIPLSEYRDALQRVGYVADAVDALELLLRLEIDKESSVAKLKTQQAAERAAEKAAKDKAAAARMAQVEQQRALARRGPVSELARAVVRGLIPFSRFEEVLAAQYDPDTVQIFVDNVEQQRQDYLDQQAAAERARQRAAVRSVSVADLDAAVLEGALTIEAFATMAAQRGYPAGDVAILTATLAARLADRTAATKKRAEAERAAKAKSIDLTRFETLVRRGVRTMPQYTALLRSLGFDDAAQADLVDLLELKIADDQAAAELRAGAHAESPTKGLTLDDTRRAVVLGLLPIDAYESFLIAAGYTTDAQIVLLDELRLDVADAEAARARRTSAEAAVTSRGVPLATVRRAARLGLVAPAVYTQRLAADGWTDDDIAIELQLLLTEIADVQAARMAREAVANPAGDRELTLGELAGAVKRGFKTLADYQARALALGLTSDAVATQLRVLGDEVEETKTAKARRDALVKDLDPTAVPIAELELAVRDGQLTLDAFARTLEQKGLAPDDAALLAGLLEADL